MLGKYILKLSDSNASYAWSHLEKKLGGNLHELFDYMSDRMVPPDGVSQVVDEASERTSPIIFNREQKMIRDLQAAISKNHQLYCDMRKELDERKGKEDGRTNHKHNTILKLCSTTFFFLFAVSVLRPATGSRWAVTPWHPLSGYVPLSPGRLK